MRKGAELLLAALGYDPDIDDEQHARAVAGAMTLAEGLHDLRLIRMALTDTKK